MNPHPAPKNYTSTVIESVCESVSYCYLSTVFVVHNVYDAVFSSSTFLFKDVLYNVPHVQCHDKRYNSTANRMCRCVSSSTQISLSDIRNLLTRSSKKFWLRQCCDTIAEHLLYNYDNCPLAFFIITQCIV